MKKIDLASRAFPSRIADLGLTLSLPRDWIAHDLPEEPLNFEDPTKLVPLIVVTAPHAAIVLAIAARPAYEDGTLSDWGRFLLENESAGLRAMGEGSLGALPALIAEATKDSEVGTLVMRTAFAEDGGRLINLTLTAPELLADAVLPVWQAALESFTLATPRGSTVRVYPPATKRAEPSVSEPEAARLPAWWTEAQALEEKGKVEEAVELVGRECDVQGAIISQAELWARAMRRCLEGGDRVGARNAWAKARDYAYAYAASATSGGEGAALSMQRDSFLEQLGPEPG